MRSDTTCAPEKMFNPRRRIPFWAILVIVLSVSAPVLQITAQTKTGCTSSCGDLNIPYPFGTKDGGSDCYYDSGESDSFVIYCDNSSDPPVPYWSNNKTNIPVDHISVDDHEMRIKILVAYNCYSSTGERTWWNSPSLTLAIFPLSSTKNRYALKSPHSRWSQLPDGKLCLKVWGCEIHYKHLAAWPKPIGDTHTRVRLK